MVLILYFFSFSFLPIILLSCLPGIEPIILLMLVNAVPCWATTLALLSTIFHCRCFLTSSVHSVSHGVMSACRQKPGSMVGQHWDQQHHEACRPSLSGQHCVAELGLPFLSRLFSSYWAELPVTLHSLCPKLHLPTIMELLTVLVPFPCGYAKTPHTSKCRQEGLFLRCNCRDSGLMVAADLCRCHAIKVCKFSLNLNSAFFSLELCLQTVPEMHLAR